MIFTIIEHLHILIYKLNKKLVNNKSHKQQNNLYIVKDKIS